MIRITIEMWPHGDETRKYPLGAINIANLGDSPDPGLGNYRADFFGKDGRPLPKRRTLIKGWPRLRESVFALVNEALARAGY